MKATHIGFILLAVILCSLVIVIPVSAVKTAEQSLDETLTRGGRFTATITGLPNTPYYVWLPRTFSMTGKPYDQPPVITDNTMGIVKDPVGGPYPIGSYKYNNGNGRTIRDDIAPSTPEMSNTQYYAGHNRLCWCCNRRVPDIRLYGTQVILGKSRKPAVHRPG